MIDSLLKTVEEASNRIKEEQKKLAESVQGNLSEAFKEIFNASPKLESFSWTQYTPYFNDGDICYFSVNDYLYVMYDGQEYDDVDKWGADNAISKNEDHYGLTPEVAKAVYPVLQLLGKIDSDIFQTIFGDHIRVTITRDGISTEDYEHE